MMPGCRRADDEDKQNAGARLLHFLRGKPACGFI